jgi:HEAT repeat protein
MKRQLFRILASVAGGLIAITACIAILTISLGDREPAYRGKTVYDWSQELKSNVMTSNQAIALIRQDVVPQLTRTMLSDTNDSTLRLWLIENLNKLPGVNIFYRTADSRRQYAADCLGEFGEGAEQAFPALLQSFKGSDLPVKGAAAKSLGKIRTHASTVVPLLIHALDDENLREDAAEALGNFGTASAEAVPHLTKLLEVRDKDLHRAVVDALQKISPPTTPLPPSS